MKELFLILWLISVLCWGVSLVNCCRYMAKREYGVPLLRNIIIMQMFNIFVLVFNSLRKIY